jgi:hypothetical protein
LSCLKPQVWEPALRGGGYDGARARSCWTRREGKGKIKKEKGEKKGEKDKESPPKRLTNRNQRLIYTP